MFFLANRPPAGRSDPDLPTFRAQRVLDGDSVIFSDGSQTLEVRLAGIDAPEGGQSYGDESRNLLRQLLRGQDVYLEIRDKDRYGRTVAVIHRADGMEVNAELVKTGGAWVHRTYGDAEWFLYEAAARKDRRGLWGRDEPIEPWVWRNQRRSRE